MDDGLALEQTGDLHVAEVGVAGDEARFSHVVEEHHRGLAQLAFVVCGNREQAEDAVAEAYARVWPRYRRGQVDDLYPYLRRAVLNQIRGGWRRRILERREESRATVDWRDGQRPEGVVDDHDLLWPALMQLPVSQRAVVVLRFVEDLSEEETAEVLDVKLGTIKSRAARGLEQLRRLIGESNND